MEDGIVVPMTIVMPTVDERDGDSMHSRNTSQGSSRYLPEPHSANDVPLLQNGQFPNLATPSTGEDTSVRRSFDSIDSRGEVPPYFEVVDQSLDEGDTQNTTVEAPVTTLEPVSSPSSPSSERANRRRSGFRNIFHALDPRARYSASVASQTGQNTSERSQNDTSPSVPRGQHRPSQSGSGSMLSLSPFRTISRQRSTHTMNSNHIASPSSISLNSISAPLTHTVVRTEFTYPKAGPTPEQLKLISSRDNFARFGMPYGADAIAYAASTSRQDLDPPPDFHAAGSEIYLPATAGAGISAAMSNSALSSTTPETSNVDETAGHESVHDESAGDDQNQAQPSGTSSSDTHAAPATTAENEALVPTTFKSHMLVPPAAYKSGSVLPPRSVSRASSTMSVASYATAAESMAEATAGLDLGSPTTLSTSCGG
jgi:hypothetical protein